MRHCVETIARIVAQDRGDARALFQLGYNLGRLSELTGLGREPFWDRWKDAVCQWDRETLGALARDLQQKYSDSNGCEFEPPSAPPGAPAAE
jgi:hypothetical protein